MARTPEEYYRLLLSLWPKGKLWDRARISGLSEFTYGGADELARVEGRSIDLKKEMHPLTIVETIDEWETEYGLPEVGQEIATTLEERRGDLYARFILNGRQNKEYFIELAERLGFEVTIVEYRPFWAGVGVAGEACGDQQNIFYWTVLIKVETDAQPDITNLQLLINKYKPAHTIALFDFSGPAFGRGFGRGFDSIPFYDGSWYPGSFGPAFSNAFRNNTGYDGENYIGAFNASFSIGFDSYRGGEFFRDAFSSSFGRET